MVAEVKFPLSVVIGAKDNITGPLDRIRGKIGTLGKSIAGLGAAATAPLIAIGAASIKMSLGFDQALGRFRASTGASIDELNALRDSVRAVGMEIGPGPTDAARGLARLAETGADARDSLLMLPTALRLGLASGEGAEAGAEMLDKVLDAFTLTAAQAPETADQIAKFSRVAGADFSSFVEDLSQIAPVARMAQLGIQDLAGPLIALRQSLPEGRSGAVPALRDALNDLIQHGMFEKGSKRVMSFTEVVRMLTASGKDATEVQELFGRTSGPALSALMRFGEEGMRGLNAEIAKAPSLTFQADARMSGLTGGMQKFKSAAEDALISIGDAGLNDAMKKLGVGISGALKWFTGLDPAIRETTILISAMVPVVAGLGVAMTLLAAHPVIAAIGVGAAAVIAAERLIRPRELGPDDRSAQERASEFGGDAALFQRMRPQAFSMEALEQKVRVEFANVPRGTSVTASDGVEVDMGLRAAGNNP